MEIDIMDRTHEYTTTKYQGDADTWRAAHEAALAASGATSGNEAESQYGRTKVHTTGGVMTFEHQPK